MANDQKAKQSAEVADQSAELETAQAAGTEPPAPEPEETTEDAEPKSRLEELAAKLRRQPESTRDQKAGDRVRGAVIIAGATIGCLFLFFGLFTTATDPTKKERRTQPSLGRPQQSTATPEAANRSVVPQLNVTQQPNDESGELTEKDLLGTMRNRGTPVPVGNPPKVDPPKPTEKRPPLSAINFEDPALAEAYRRQGLTPPPRRTEVTDWNAAVAEYQSKQSAQAAPPVPATNPSEALRKSSFVYVRASSANNSAPRSMAPALMERRSAKLLPQGTKLVARLQFAVSSAAKVPVVAVIEYNYERDGELIVPAGSKAYGSLSQATPQGWVNLKFDALEYPNGDQEKINGSALSMDQGILRGFVNGRNTGKKFLTRTLTGIGTIAAFAVGGRGLGGQIDNSILLRERLSSNVAMAGEQELAMLAYQQNIVVTVPANTRFYLVLNEPGINSAPAQEGLIPSTRPTGDATAIAAASGAGPLAGMSLKELQELISIRNEMREMNRLIRMQNQPVAIPEPEK